jgi:hypothetical protein
MNILDIIKSEEDNWIILFQKIKIQTYLSSNLNCSLYRTITNSRRKFRNTTNRDFFRNNFSNGFYRSIISNNEFQFLYFLKTKPKIEKKQILSETKLRMKKIVFSNIDTLETSQLPIEDQILLSDKNGFGYYQKVLESYSNIRQ